MQIHKYQPKLFGYVFYREKDIREIKTLLILGHEVTYSHRDTWVKVGNKIFNGFSREDIEKIMEENEDESTKS